MKKFTLLFTIASLLLANPTFAQTSGKGAANASKTASNGNFAWGIGITALAVIGVVVGITAASATDSPASFSH